MSNFVITPRMEAKRIELDKPTQWKLCISYICNTHNVAVLVTQTYTLRTIHIIHVRTQFGITGDMFVVVLLVCLYACYFDFHVYHIHSHMLYTCICRAYVYVYYDWLLTYEAKTLAATAFPYCRRNVFFSPPISAPVPNIPSIWAEACYELLELCFEHTEQNFFIRLVEFVVPIPIIESAAKSWMIGIQ